MDFAGESPAAASHLEDEKTIGNNHLQLTIVLEFPHFQEYICQREVGESSHNGWIWISPGNDQQELIFILFLVGSVLSQKNVFRRQVFLKNEIKDVMSMRL